MRRYVDIKPFVVVASHVHCLSKPGMLLSGHLVVGGRRDQCVCVHIAIRSHCCCYGYLYFL